uniref:von Willebrand factor A domain-containing protein 5A-like n=1 Tax=Seriola lalandi dorsalis TaxID=1841481 RepID=A0A3B4XNV1_SERLL
MVNCCGLLTANKALVPLKSIEVELEVRDHVATVVSTLTYENKEDKPVEAVFVFPLPGDAAVCHFSAKIGQTQIVAEVKEKQQAREEYDDALSSGQQAFLLEESEQSPDIFTLSVGSLPPGESASIRLEYVTELAVQADDGLRFCLPAVLNPRYQPQGASVQVTSVPASLVPYSLSFSARVSSPRPVSKVESNCSLDPLQHLNTEQTQATVKLAAGHKFDRDVELLIYYKDAHQPTAVVEAGQTTAKTGTLMGDPVVMLSLYPEFPQSVMSSVASCGEFVLLMDRSGSMGSRMNNGRGQQTRISSARDTLLLLLKSLPMGCYFNIYSFGSSFEHIFPKSVEYSQSSMEEALKKVELMEANLGGTEILKPLKHIYSQPCIPSQPRQLFVFTDGEVFNTKEVINLVKKNSGSHRCFSFGIGEGASSALINGLAKEGGGHAQFITETDRMQPKVMQSLRFALQPAVVDITVTWDLPKGVSATALSPPITALFQGQRSLVYAQLTGQVGAAPSHSELPLCSDLFQHSTYCTSLPVFTPLSYLQINSPQVGCSDSDSLPGDGRERTQRTCPIRGQQFLHSDSRTSGALMLYILLSFCHHQVKMYLCITLLYDQTPAKLMTFPSASAVLSSALDDEDIERPIPKQPCRDSLLQVVSLQNASGSWLFNPALADVLGKTSEEVDKSKPALVGYLWATILALIWLHAFKMDAKEEWELLAMKAVSWLRAQNGKNHDSNADAVVFNSISTCVHSSVLSAD